MGIKVKSSTIFDSGALKCFPDIMPQDMLTLSAGVHAFYFMAFRSKSIFNCN